MERREKEKLYVRAASGLVREVSTAKATFFNIGAAVAWEPGWVTAWAANVPAFLLFGLSSLGWSVLIAGIFDMLILSIIYMYLATALPRSGGDYIYTTRIVNPLLGWIEGWTFMFSVLAFMGYGTYVLTLCIADFAQIIGIAYPTWVNIAAWLKTPTGILISGIITMILIGVVILQPISRYHKINSAMVAIGLGVFFITVFTALSINTTTFSENLQRLIGFTPQDIVSLAADKGFSVGTFYIGALGPMLAFGLVQFVGFQYAGFMAGELKGNVGKNIITSFLITCAIVILLHTIWLQVFISKLGYDFMAASSFLFYSYPEAMKNLIPTAHTLTAIAMPSLAIPLAVSSLCNYLIGFALHTTWLVTTTRVAFAWAMDRLIPSFFAKVDPRTNNPLYLTILFYVIWVVQFVMYVMGIPFLMGTYTSILLAMFLWIVPGISAILLPFKRKDLYDLLPASMKRKVGLPIVTILGIIWICFSIPIYALYIIWPIISSFYGLSTVEIMAYGISTGVVVFAVIVAVGVIIYYLSKWYNKRKGIDISLIFKTVPPE